MSLLSNNLVRLGALALIVVGVILAVVLGSGGSSSSPPTTVQAGGPTSRVPGARQFTVALPSSWAAVPASQLSRYPGDPVAVLIRKDRTGLIVVTQSRSNPRLSLAALGASLGKRIQGRFADAKQITAKVVAVRAGTAYYYSFARTRAGTANGVLVVPAGPVTYQLNSVVPGNQPQAAKEAGQIFVSFKVS